MSNAIGHKVGNAPFKERLWRVELVGSLMPASPARLALNGGLSTLCSEEALLL